MNLDQIRKKAPQLKTLAKKNDIAKVFIFGCIVRGDSTPKSNIAFHLKMQIEASLFGIAGFMYESEKSSDISVDVVPLSPMSRVEDMDFVRYLQIEDRLL
jgi:predicted nucleotidyltransferase